MVTYHFPESIRLFSSSADPNVLLRDPMFLPFAINNVTMSNFDPIWPIYSRSQVGFRSNDDDAEPWVIIDLGVEQIITSINLMQSGDSSYLRGYFYFFLSLFYVT